MKSPRAVPPEDISAGEFFTRWVPAMVADDEERRSKLMGTTASIEFTLTEPRQQIFTVYIDEGAVLGAHGPHHDPDLRVELDEPTWRALNRGGISAPQALLRRKVKIHGDLMLAMKLHLILG
jgi:putative sterol carrier protein